MKEKPKKLVIEIDDIAGTPQIWFNGKYISAGLVDLKIDWHTNEATPSKKKAYIGYYEGHDYTELSLSSLLSDSTVTNDD